MLDFFRNLLSTDGFVPRRTCGDWSDGHVLLHTTADLLVWLAYLSIPLVFGYFLWRRRWAVPFPGLVALFAAFILACGFTHLLDALMFVWPAYRLSGLVKGLTAAASWLTVAALVPAVPRLLAFVDAVEQRPTGWRPPAEVGRPQRYVAAAGLAGLALLARFALDGVLDEGQGIVLALLAVIAAAWYGGFWPGMLALALGGGGFAVLFIAPRGQLRADGLGDQMNLALFVFCGTAAAALGDAQRAARVAAEAATADLHESNRRLARSQWATTEALTQLDAFLTHAPVGLAFYDPDLRYVRINNYLAQANRLPVDAHLGRPFAEVLPDMPAEVAAGFRRVLDTGEPIRDLAVEGTTGPDSVWRVSAYPARDPHGVTVGLAVVAQDVTDRVRQERAVQASEARLRAFFDHTPESVYVKDPSGRYALVGRAFAERAGRPAAEMVGRADAELFGGDLAARFAADDAAVLATGEPVRREETFEHAGRDYTFLTAKFRLPDGSLGGVSTDLTDRKRAEEAVRRAEERLRQVTDTAPALIALVSPDHRYQLVNRGYEEQFGRPRAELVGRHVRELLGQELYARNGPLLDRCLAGESLAFENDLPAADGAVRSLAVTYTPERDPDGRVRGAVVFTTDVTARRRAEAAVRASEERLRLAAQVAGLAVAEVDYQADAVHLTAEAAALLGWPAEPRTVPRADLHARVPAADHPALAAHQAAALDPAGDGVFALEHRFARADGAVRWFSVRKQVRFAAGRPAGALVAMTDVTARKEGEARVAASEARFRQLADAMPQIVFAARPDGTVDYFNGRWYEYTGFPTDGRVGEESWAGVHEPDRLAAVVERWQQSVRTGEPYEIEYPLRRHDGVWRWHLGRATPVRDETGAIVRWYGTNTDIDDQRRAAEAVRAAEERVRTALEAAGAGSFAWDLPTGRLELNRPSAELFELPELTTGADALARVHPEDAPRVDAAIRAALAGTARYEAEFRLRTPAGGERWVIGRGDVSRDAAGSPVRMSGVNLDVTARKRAEAAERAGQERLEFVLRSCGIGLWDNPLPLGALNWDERVKAHFHLPADSQPTIDDFWDRLHPADREPTRRAIEAALAPGGPEFDVDYRTTDPATGAERWVRAIGRPALGPGGAAAAFSGITLDITARKRAEAALRAGEERLRLATTGAGVGIWECDLRTGRGSWSPEAVALIGGGRAEFTPADWLDAMHPADRDRAAAAWQRAVDEGAPYEVEVRTAAPAADGGDRWLLSRGRVERDAAGTPVRGTGVLLDITPRKRAEAELADAQARLRDRFAELEAVYQAAPVGLAAFDRGLRYLRINPALAAMNGPPADAHLGRTVREVVPDLADQFEAAARRVLAGGETVRLDLRGQTPGRPGVERVWDEQLYPIRDAAGAVAGVGVTVDEVTDRLRAEAAVRASEERLQLAVAIARMGTFDIDLLTDAVEVNEPGMAIYGWDSPRTTFAQVQTHFHPADAPEVLRRVQAALDPAGPGEFEVEQRITRTDGAERWLRVRGRATFAGDGADRRAVRLVGAYLDVTDQRAAEAAIRESEANARLALEVAELGTWRVYPADGWRVDADPRTRALVGLSTADHLAMTDVHPVVHPDHRAAVDAAMAAAADPAGDGLYALEVPHVHPDGRVTWVSARGQTEFAPDGRPVVMRGTVLDITARKRAEERQRLLADLATETVARSSPAGVLAAGLRLLADHLGADRCVYADADPAAGAVTITHEECRGVPSVAGRHHLADFGLVAAGLLDSDAPYAVADTAADPALAGLQPAYQAVQVRGMVNAPVRVGGRLAALVAVHTAAPRVWAAAEVELVREVAARLWESVERVKAAQALRDSEERYRALIELSPQMVWAADPAGRATYYSQSWYEYTGLAPAEALGGGWDRIVHPDHLAATAAAWAAAVEAGADQYEAEAPLRRAADGAYRWHLNRARLVRDAAGRPDRWVGVAVDVDDQKRAEAATVDGARRYAGLLAAQAEVAAAADRGTVLAAVARLILPVLRADGAAVERLDGDELAYEATAGAAEPFVGLTLPAADSLSGRCARDNRPLVCGDTEADDRVDRAACRVTGVRSMVVAPLAHRGRVVGVLKATAARPGAFDERDAVTLQLLAGVAAGGLSGAAEARAEEALRASEARFRGLADTAPQVIWEADLDGRTTFLSRYREEYTGRPFDPAAPEDWADLIRPDQAARAAANWAEAVAGADRYEDLYPVRRADGEYRWFQARGRLVRRPDGTPDRWVGTSTDIHDRVQAEEALAGTQRTLTLSLAAGNAGAYTWDLATDRVTVRTADPASPGTLATSRPVSYDQWLARVHPDDRARVRAAVQAAKADRRPFALQFRVGTPDSGWRWVENRGQFEYAPDGSPVRLVGVRLDVHDRTAAELALADTRRALTLSLAVARAAAWEWDRPADRVVMRAPDPDRPGELLQAPPKTYAGRLEAVHPDDRERVRAAYDAAWAGGGSVAVEYRRADGAGGWRWVEARGQCQPAAGPDGAAGRMIGVVIDVHDRKAAEAAAREADALFRAMADSIPQLAWTCRADGFFDWYNSRWYEYTGTTPDEMRGEGWEAVHDPAELARMRPGWAAALAAGTPYEDTFPLRRFDGQFRWFLTRARPIRDDAGRIVRWFGTNTDVTDQRRLEAELRAANDRYRFLDALGQATRDADARATLETTCRLLGGHLGTTRVAYADVDPDGDGFVIPHDWTDGAASTVGSYSLARFGPAAVAAMTAGRPLVVRDVDAELGPAGGADMFNAIGIKAVVCCPLVKGGRLAAMMAVHQAAPRDWTPAEVGLVAEVVERSWAHVERARAEDEAREAAARFRTLAESVPALVWSCPADGPTDYHSSRWEEYTGRPAAELAGGGWMESVHPDDRPAVAAAWDAARPGGRPFAVEYRLRRHDGADRWQLAQALPQRDPVGRVVRWYGTVTDIDDQKALEHDLRQKTAILDTINHHSPTLVYVKDVHSRAVMYNPATLRVLGRTAAEVLGRSEAEYMPAEVAAPLLANDRRVIDTGEVLVAEERSPAGDVFLSIKAPHRGPAGDIVGLIGVSVDITAQKRLEGDLRAAGERFRTLTEAIPQMVWNADADGRVSYVNSRWREYTGQGEGATAADWWEQIAHPADAQGVAEAWAKVVLYQRPEPVQTELRVQRAADGAYRWFSMGVVPLTRPDGSIDQWIGSLSDVHDLKTAEEAIRASEARFRHLLDAMPNLVWVTDADGRVVQLNRYWAAYTGRPLAELVGDGWLSLLHPDDAPGAVAAWQAAVRHRAPFAAEFRYRVADGTHRWQLARGTPVPGPDGRLSQWFGTTTDIDDRRRAADLLEAQVKERTAELHRSNSELEKFAYVASHDLQEPLRKVQAFGDRLATRFADPLGPAGKDYIERMQASAARMQTLINDLLAFSRVNSKAKPFEPVPLNKLVDGVLSDLEALTTRTGATVTVGDLPTVHGDNGQLRQLFQNLIANACKFHKPGRPPGITLVAERLDALPAAADPPPGLPAGWRVSVCDDGIGFEQQYADRIFEVFQRLHGRGQYEGTGIGLAICRKIAERHGGIITARGRPGEGATFAVDLPDPPEDQRA